VADLTTVISDLAAGSEDIDRMVAGLNAAGWSLPTPAPGWTIADQVTHLAFILHAAAIAATDAAAFQPLAADAMADFDGAAKAAFEEYRDGSPRTLLQWWSAARTACVRALAAVPADQTVPWLIDPLPPAVLARAAMMEMFAHGQDIADALGLRPERTDRLVHVVEFAVLARDFGYQARGLTPPDTEFRFELIAPSGELWVFGPQDAAQRVTGPAADFCLLATRRRHRGDLAVTASGADAERWLDIAQAYGGPAGPGRTPRQFAATRP
jgi:uncharacterized protein (TIGR03084 family)